MTDEASLQDILDPDANPCDRCGGPIGRDFMLCDPCFGFYCSRCTERHTLEEHIGPKERATLTAWREQAAQRREGT